MVPPRIEHMFDATQEVASRVGDHGPAEVLAFVRDRRREADRAEAQVLVAAAHWADLHPVVDGAEAGALLDRAPDGRERLVPLAGPGTPAVAEFAPAELGAALGLSTHAATALVGDALELRHRLPRLWQRVVRGDLPAWRARRIADHTKSLSREAATYVDEQASWCAHKISPARVQRLVDAAVLRFDPERASAEAASAREGRGVWVGDQISTGGTLSVLIEADAGDVVAFDGTLSEVADALAALGDPDPVDVRRSKALGRIADPQGALDLLAGRPVPGRGGGPGGSGAGHGVARGGTLFVHLSAAAVGSWLGDPLSADEAGVARVEGLGPVLAAQVREWAGNGDLRVQPVIDLADHRAVDAYEVPARMSEQVLLRDPCCPFPYCVNLSRRKDRDHIEEYDDGGESGRPPPGQTRPDNLAALCRRHHRVKTHSSWHYEMPHPGTYLWTSPHGLRYRVDGSGTTALAPA